MTPVGFEPTQLALVELESTPLDHSGKLSCQMIAPASHMCARPRRLPFQFTNSRLDPMRVSMGFEAFHPGAVL